MRNKMMIGFLVIGLLGVGLMTSGCEDSLEFPETSTTTITTTTITTTTITTTTITTTTTLPKVATPTFSVAGGLYTADTLVVTIECSTDGADIYYDLSGLAAAAAGASSTEVTLNRSRTLRAFAVKSGYQNSETAIATYEIYGWQALDGGLQNDTYSVVFYNGDPYFAGSFDYAGNQVADTAGLARWNGFSWAHVADIEPNTWLPRCMLFDGNYIYVGADPDGNYVQGVPGTYGIARWDTVNLTWEALGGGASAQYDVVWSLADDGTYLYAGGYFNVMSGVSGAYSVARWKKAANTWEVMDTGLNGDAYAVLLVGSDLYVGGDFADASGVANTSRIACWNTFTEQWEALDQGLNGDVQALYHDGTDLYVGGNFTAEAGSATALNGIARWNGSSWSAVGNGVSDSDVDTHNVEGLAGYGDHIYAGGNFENMSGVPHTLHIARWDKVRATWEAMGKGIHGDEVEGLTCDAAGNLYFAGNDTSGSGTVMMLNTGWWGRK